MIDAANPNIDAGIEIDVDQARIVVAVSLRRLRPGLGSCRGALVGDDRLIRDRFGIIGCHRLDCRDGSFLHHHGLVCLSSWSLLSPRFGFRWGRDRFILSAVVNGGGDIAHRLDNSAKKRVIVVRESKRTGYDGEAQPEHEGNEQAIGTHCEGPPGMGVTQSAPPKRLVVRSCREPVRCAWHRASRRATYAGGTGTSCASPEGMRTL